MADHIDPMTEAREAVASALRSAELANSSTLRARYANVAATLALAEQQRIANLLALAVSNNVLLAEQPATDAADALVAYRSHGEPGLGGWFELRPDVASALGIDNDNDNDKESNNE